MIKLPFRWVLFIQLFRSPHMVEDYWAKTVEEGELIRDALTVKYDEQEDMHVKSQYFIQNNQDRIAVFQYLEEGTV